MPNWIKSENLIKTTRAMGNIGCFNCRFAKPVDKNDKYYEYYKIQCFKHSWYIESGKMICWITSAKQTAWEKIETEDKKQKVKQLKLV